MLKHNLSGCQTALGSAARHFSIEQSEETLPIVLGLKATARKNMVSIALVLEKHDGEPIGDGVLPECGPLGSRRFLFRDRFEAILENELVRVPVCVFAVLPSLFISEFGNNEQGSERAEDQDAADKERKSISESTAGLKEVVEHEEEDQRVENKADRKNVFQRSRAADDPHGNDEFFQRQIARDMDRLQQRRGGRVGRT